MIIPNSTYVVPEAFIAVLRRHIKEDMPHARVGKDTQRQLAPWKTNTRHVLDVRVMDNGKVDVTVDLAMSTGKAEVAAA